MLYNKKDIQKIEKYAKPYLEEIQILFNDNRPNPLKSSITFLKKNDPRSAIKQCELITRQLLYKHYSIEINKMSLNKLIKSINSEFQNDPLTCVQISHILYSANNIECIDLASAIFSLKNLIQILKIFKPEISSKISIEKELNDIRYKLLDDFYLKDTKNVFNYQKEFDSLFPNENPIQEAIDLTSKKENKYKSCLKATRTALEKLTVELFVNKFDRKLLPEKATIGNVLFHEQFMTTYIRHYHTFDSLREVGNWGSHTNDYPIDDKYALFSLYSLYIVIRWFYGIDYAEVYKKHMIKKKIKTASFAAVLLISALIFSPKSVYIRSLITGDFDETMKRIKLIERSNDIQIRDQFWCKFCKLIDCQDYFMYIQKKDYSTAMQLITNICLTDIKDHFWLDYCLLKTGNATIKDLTKTYEYYKKENHKEYKLIYLFFISILPYINSSNKDTTKGINFFLNYSPQNSDPMTFFKDLTKLYIN